MTSSPIIVREEPILRSLSEEVITTRLNNQNRSIKCISVISLTLQATIINEWFVCSMLLVVVTVCQTRRWEYLFSLTTLKDDGIMTAYIHYLLVRPEYQGKGIGNQLIERTKEKYKDYLRIVLVAYDKECGFYEHCGFKKGKDI